MESNEHTARAAASELPPPLPPRSVTTSTPNKPADAATLAMEQGGHLRRPDSALPPGITGWCWGGFLLNWIWAIRFRVWWGLLALVPVLGLAAMVWLGLKGREMAWLKGRWDSVDAFDRTQRHWSIAGLAIAIVFGLAYGGNLAYVQWQAKRADATSTEDLAKVISAPVDLKQLGVAPPAPTALIVHGEVGIDDDLPRRIATRYGVLEIRTLPDKSSALFLGDQQLFSGSDANWHALVRKFERSDGSEAILMRSSGGRGTSCEALYFFVVVAPSGFRFSPEFGTCTPAVSYEQRGDMITLTMQRMGGMSHVQFGADDKVLEDGKLLTLRDDIDPSK